MAELSFVESIAGRGLPNPDKRAALSDQVFAAHDKLDHAAEVLRETLACNLEGDGYPVKLGIAEVAFSEAIDAFDKARRETVGFLLSDGGMTVAGISSAEAL